MKERLDELKQQFISATSEKERETIMLEIGNLVNEDAESVADCTLQQIRTSIDNAGVEIAKSNRGGARKGAGRKATGRTKKTITLCLSYDVIELLNAHKGNKSAYIESLIRADAFSE